MTVVLLRSSFKSCLRKQCHVPAARPLSIHHHVQYPRARQTRSPLKTSAKPQQKPPSSHEKSAGAYKHAPTAKQGDAQQNLVTWSALETINATKRTPPIVANYEQVENNLDEYEDEDMYRDYDTGVIRREPTMTATAYRWDTSIPNGAKIKKATQIFTKFPPRFVTSAAEFANMQIGHMPEVTFIGRSNVGKSSLLNALFNRTSMASTSSKPGRTRLMNAFSIAEGRIQLVDMPGYGHASRPEWGNEIIAYLRGRRTLRRCFILMDPVHGAKESDRMMMEILGQAGIPYQVVLSKVDRLPGARSSKSDEAGEGLKKVFEECRELIERMGGTSGLGEIIATCGQPETKGSFKSGIDDLRWAVLVAAGLTKT